MAIKDSKELETNERYSLEEYSFRIERSSGTSPNYDKIEAICTKGGKNARKSIQIPSTTKIDGWYVEANDTEATVYASIRPQTGGNEKTSPLIPDGVIYGGTNYVKTQTNGSGSRAYYYVTQEAGNGVFIHYDYSNFTTVFASSTPNATWAGTYIGYSAETGEPFETDQTSGTVDRSFEYDGRTVYYYVVINAGRPVAVLEPPKNPNMRADYAAWTAIYGIPSGGEYGDSKEVIVGRFAIDLEDAGGVGPGSDWEDPEDYDPDWEEGDPTHTLYVDVTGALSGRHNDPIVDPSYSYIPADKATVKDYGCGGDGGHGGGGGAGASTVVVHKFATNQANSKEVTALARRHGYGSGGGKGGKGGDGCILIYY